MDNMLNIDDEWEQFLLEGSCPNIDKEDDFVPTLNKLTDCFGYNEKKESAIHLKSDSDTIITSEENIDDVPECTEIYISTKSKIAYLNQMIDLQKIFWGIHIIPYSQPIEGIIKKQMKFNSTTQEELDDIKSHLQKENYYEEHIITSIQNPKGRIKFKDIRKISVGISKKDLLSYRIKKKSAFYNCFVMIMRVKEGDIFKEYHIKIFNTGKLEIPGVQNDTIYDLILDKILNTLQPFITTDIPLNYKQKSDTVLINSNFNCGFYINREVLHELLKYKYHIQSIYDPCSYPGIQSKFYYNPDVEEQTGCKIPQDKIHLYPNVMEVSFMIFRTGSILIVGMCDENVLYCIYDYLKRILTTEFHKINQMIITGSKHLIKDKRKKNRKKIILVDI